MEPFYDGFLFSSPDFSFAEMVKHFWVNLWFLTPLKSQHSKSFETCRWHLMAVSQVGHTSQWGNETKMSTTVGLWGTTELGWTYPLKDTPVSKSGNPALGLDTISHIHWEHWCSLSQEELITHFLFYILAVTRTQILTVMSQLVSLQPARVLWSKKLCSLSCLICAPWLTMVPVAWLSTQVMSVKRHTCTSHVSHTRYLLQKS